MPTPTFHLLSPYEKIFGKSPNYSKFKIFSCLCYPWLHLYSVHKLDARSKPCVFLGYSFTQSAYLCYHPSTSRTYVSRHVKFVESVFPFHTLSSSSPCPQHDTISTWIPPPILVQDSPSSLPPNVTPSNVQLFEQPQCVVSSPSTAPLPLATNTLPQPLPLIIDNPCPNLQPNPSTSQPNPTHSLTIRAKNNIHKLIQKLNLSTQLFPSVDLEPTSVT